MEKKHLNKLNGLSGDERFKDKLVSYFTRCSVEIPPFFRKLRRVGLMVAAAGTAVVVAPISLPAVVVTIGGYLIVGGAVASAVSQAAIDDAGSCLSSDSSSSRIRAKEPNE